MRGHGRSWEKQEWCQTSQPHLWFLLPRIRCHKLKLVESKFGGEKESGEQKKFVWQNDYLSCVFSFYKIFSICNVCIDDGLFWVVVVCCCVWASPCEPGDAGSLSMHLCLEHPLAAACCEDGLSGGAELSGLYFFLLRLGLYLVLITQAFTNHSACSGIPTTAPSVFFQNFYFLILVGLKIACLLQVCVRIGSS